MAEERNDTERTTISYKLRSKDIFKLIFMIHWILLVLPTAFLAGHILLAVSKYYTSLESIASLILFGLSVLGVLYLYISQYFIFKKLYYYTDPNANYYAEFSSAGLTLYQEEGANLTQYTWKDFMKCRETKNVYYFYFRYDRAIIIRKQHFVKGNNIDLRNLIKECSAKFKAYRK